MQVGRCALLVLLLSSGGVATATQPEKLNLTSAVKLARAWVFQVNSKMNPEVKLELQDVTTPEIWSTLGAQLFAKTPESFVFLPNYFVIKNEQVYPTMDMKSWCLLHLNQGSGEAFVYSRVWGSGIVRATIHALLSSPDRLIPLDADLSFLGELSVSCNANAVVALDVVRLFIPSDQPVSLPARLGTAIVEREHGSVSLRIQIEPSVPRAIRKAIWK